MLENLTDYEISLIQKHRAEQAEQAARIAFRSKALKTAVAFDQWSEASGEGLTFSTFINTFGYQEHNGRRMYEAVQRILAAAARTTST